MTIYIYADDKITEIPNCSLIFKAFYFLHNYACFFLISDTSNKKDLLLTFVLQIDACSVFAKHRLRFLSEINRLLGKTHKACEIFIKLVVALQQITDFHSYIC